MKHAYIAAVMLACMAPQAYAAEQAMFKETGFEAEREMLRNNPVLATEIRTGVVDIHKIGIATLDVNNDGTDEVFVHDYNSYSCGSQGCTTYVMQKQGTQYLAIMSVIAGDAIAVGDKSSHNNGYKDIYIQNNNGKPVRWSFNGKEYVLND